MSWPPRVVLALQASSRFGLASNLNVCQVDALQLDRLVYDLGLDTRFTKLERLSSAARLQSLLSCCPLEIPISGAAAGVQNWSLPTQTPDSAFAAMFACTETRASQFDAEASEQRFEEFARLYLVQFVQSEPFGAVLLREYAVALAARADAPTALMRCTALVRLSRQTM